jgi:protein-S-isoprenylcysteine O-methyltransferase Ste14
MIGRVARLRVPLGFLAAAIAYWLARPDPVSIGAGAGIALPGELLRIWASGHILKGREITSSGPYRYVRHPLYLGSTIMGIGFAVAARSWWVAAIVAVYLGVTLVAAMRTEEAVLDARFAGEYAAYREGRAVPATRPFSAARVLANREYRAVAGYLIAFALLAIRMRW